MSVAEYSLGAFAAAAMMLSMSLVSCSDKPTEPAVTKRSYKIAYVSISDGSYGVFTMNNNGSGQKRLTANSRIVPHISWSPDGSKIAYTSQQPPHDNLYEIYVVRADGTFPTRLTISSHLAGEVEARPVWSPNGSKLTFQSYRDGKSEIYVMNADGSNQTNVTHDPNHNYDPVWRPDGMGVTFVSARDDRDRRYELYFVNTDGTMREIVGLTSYDSLSSPFWFPVGSTIGYLYVGQSSQVVGPVVCTLTPGHIVCEGDYFGTLYTAGNVTCPVWSPEGSKLAFVSNAEGKKDIYVANTRSSSESPKRLTSSLMGEGATMPAWSPDGAEIIFTADWTGNAEIYIMNADGTNVRRLSTSSGSAYPTGALSEY